MFCLGYALKSNKIEKNVCIPTLERVLRCVIQFAVDDLNIDYVTFVQSGLDWFVDSGRYSVGDDKKRKEPNENQKEMDEGRWETSPSEIKSIFRNEIALQSDPSLLGCYTCGSIFSQIEFGWKIKTYFLVGRQLLRSAGATSDARLSPQVWYWDEGHLVGSMHRKFQILIWNARVLYALYRCNTQKRLSSMRLKIRMCDFHHLNLYLLRHKKKYSKVKIIQTWTHFNLWLGRLTTLQRK